VVPFIQSIPNTPATSFDFIRHDQEVI